jgi:Sulfotransferase family
VNLFVLGMRRSGTTILYDALQEDPELNCFYEPLREEDVTEGGGSGAREGDAFAQMRALRTDFRERRYPDLPIEEFNWGGPRKPPLEVEADLPPHCRELLAELLERSPAAIKETRLWSKVPVLAALDPGAALVHVVRDPRAVAASIVLGRGQRRREMLPTADHFFADRSKRKLWSSRAISRRLVRAEGKRVRDPSNAERVLLVWRASFERTRRDGLARFGDRYVLVRNEDLRADPARVLADVYAALGRDVPAPVSAWAQENVRPPAEPYAADDPRWRQALEVAGAIEAVSDAGYGELLAGGAANLKT